MTDPNAIAPVAALRVLMHRRWVMFFSCCFLLLLVGVSPFDRQLSLWAQDLGFEAFADFQHQTLFDTGRFGGSDIGLVFQIACGLMAFACFLPERLRPKRLKDGFDGRLGRFSIFILVSSVYSAVVLIQGIKFAWGRVRPYSVFSDDLALYTEWYQFGLHSIGDGRFAGSFPSGHVAGASAVLGLLWLWPRGTRWPKRGAWIFLGAICFSAWFLMTAGRVMARDHWPSDGVFSALVVLLSYAYFAELLLPNGRMPKTGEAGFAPLPWASLAKVFGWSVGAILALWLVREISLLV